MSVLREATAAVPNSGTDSAWVKTQGEELVGVLLPAAIDGTGFSFRVGFGSAEPDHDGKVVSDLAGAAMAAASVAAGEYVVLTPGSLNADWIKIVMGTSQSGARSLKLYFRTR